MLTRHNATGNIPRLEGAPFLTCGFLAERTRLNFCVCLPLQPENVLLDSDGYICLTDFGLSKEGVEDDADGARTFCGTPEYLAPEVLQEGSAHGKAVDWWAMGTLLYEMLNGLPPFYSQDIREMYDKILSERLEFPRHFRPHTQTFLAGLLERDPALRFDIGQIKAHQYFAGVDWGKLMRKEYQAPMTPKLKDELDLSYFDTQFTSQQPFESMQEESSMRISVTGGLFEGFTYDQTAADAARLNTGDAELSFLEEQDEEEDDQEEETRAQDQHIATSSALLGSDGGEL